VVDWRWWLCGKQALNWKKVCGARPDLGNGCHGLRVAPSRPNALDMDRLLSVPFIHSSILMR